MKTEKKLIVATIYNKPVISKAEARAESEKALKKFLKSGGAIEIVKSRKNPKSKLSAKNSKGFVKGTSGFPTGYPKKMLSV